MENDRWIRTRRGRPRRYFLNPGIGELSPMQIRERLHTAAASHLLSTIMFAPRMELGDIRVRHSISEKEVWDIALREQYWPYSKFETYLRELVDAGFLRPRARIASRSYERSSSVVAHGNHGTSLNDKTPPDVRAS